jgi:DNA-binding beta-propeller fold protein YncE
MKKFSQSGYAAIGVSCLLMLIGCTTMATKGTEYALAQQFDLGPTSKWDFIALDTSRNRLYVTAGTHVLVIDSRNGKAIGEIANTAGVHGVAIAQDLKLGFTSNGATNTLTVFDLDTLKTLREIPSGGLNPDALLYDPNTQKLFVMNGKSQEMSIFDAKTFNLLKITKLSGKPELAVIDNEGRLFVNIEQKPGSIDVLDTSSGNIKATWKLDGCEDPSGLALDRKHQRLFSACQNKVMVVTNARDGSRIGAIPIGAGPDGAIFDEVDQLVISPNGGDGTLTIAEADSLSSYRVRADIKTALKAKTIVMDSASKRMYLPTVINERFTVLVVAAATH